MDNTMISMSNPNKYNGWTNYETWLCNLWFDYFDFTEQLEMFEGVEDKDDILNIIEDYIQSSVEEFVEYHFSPGDSHGFIHDMLNSAIKTIDFRDIAEHYVDDVVDELAALNDEDDTPEDSTSQTSRDMCGAVWTNQFLTTIPSTSGWFFFFAFAASHSPRTQLNATSTPHQGLNAADP